MIGIDLAEDKQALAVIDHDVRVLARKTVRVKAFRLGQVLDWAVAQARLKGFEQVTVACEPGRRSAGRRRPGGGDRRRMGRVAGHGRRCRGWWRECWRPAADRVRPGRSVLPNWRSS